MLMFGHNNMKCRAELGDLTCLCYAIVMAHICM